MDKRTVVMVVMDGWGVGKRDDTNPIYVKNPSTIDFIKRNYLAGSLQASGIAVGLPWEEEGNSEVGHLTLGAGRVLYQHYPRITLAIRDGSFFKNAVLLDAIKRAKDNHTSVNLVGLLSSGNVHASFDHLEALIELAKREELMRLNLHLFTDGKDGGAKDGARLLKELIDRANKIGYKGLRVGSISGRYYGMDREGHWERTERAYAAMTDNAEPESQDLHIIDGEPINAIKLIEWSYGEGFTDEHIPPTTTDKDGIIKDGDSVIFFNFREDSIRQLAERFLTGISNINIEKPEFNSLNMVAFTNYNDKYGLPVAFPPEVVLNPLGKVISDKGLRQLRLAESNKYAHVTYFFNGLQELPFRDEFRILIPSQNVPRHDEHPEMMASEITNRAVEALNEGIYDFILINYANADIVAHTGNYNATLKAVEVVDNEIKRLMEAVLKLDGVMVITADHGNAEKLIEGQTGLPETKHNTSPVPIYIVGKGFKREKDDFDVDRAEKESAGLISDVAPTVLEIMGIPAPEEMTGISLLKILQ